MEKGFCRCGRSACCSLRTAWPEAKRRAIPSLPTSLDEALDALDADRDFLLAGEVFSDDLIDAYIELKMEEGTRMRMTTHPVEFDMYYSC